jgi:transposase
MPYLGPAPREYSSGGKRNQGGIAEAGNTRIRKLLTGIGPALPRQLAGYSWG